MSANELDPRAYIPGSLREDKPKTEGQPIHALPMPPYDFQGNTTPTDNLEAGAGDLVERQLPELLTEEERATMLRKAEWLWNALQQNNLGGFSGINRPFYILNAFKEVIEEYGHRDVGLRWSKNDLDFARAALSQEAPK